VKLKKAKDTDMDFSNAPLPWRYRDDTRDVVASDGSVVCKAGDTVSDGYLSGPLIVQIASRIAKASNRAARLQELIVAERVHSNDMLIWMKGRLSAFREISATETGTKESGGS